MPSTSTLVDSIYTRRVSAGECYPPDLVKSRYLFTTKDANFHESLATPSIMENTGRMG